MRKILSLAILLALSSSCGARDRSALVLLDLQRDFLAEDGRFTVEEAQVEPMLDVVRALLPDARSAGAPVVRIHNAFSPRDPGNDARHGAAVRGTDGAQADPRVPEGEDAMFDKQVADAFSNPALHRWLRDHGVGHLVITGVFADQCVTVTALGALARGYRVTIVERGVAARTQDERAGALERLGGVGADVVSSTGDVAW